MINFRRLNAVARKETLHLMRDWRSLTLALAIPLILILLYGYALTLDLRLVPGPVAAKVGGVEVVRVIVGGRGQEQAFPGSQGRARLCH